MSSASWPSAPQALQQTPQPWKGAEEPVRASLGEQRSHECERARSLPKAKPWPQARRQSGEDTEPMCPGGHSRPPFQRRWLEAQVGGGQDPPYKRWKIPGHPSPAEPPPGHRRLLGAARLTQGPACCPVTATGSPQLRELGQTPGPHETASQGLCQAGGARAAGGVLPWGPPHSPSSRSFRAAASRRVTLAGKRTRFCGPLMAASLLGRCLWPFLPWASFSAWAHIFTCWARRFWACFSRSCVLILPTMGISARSSRCSAMAGAAGQGGCSGHQMGEQGGRAGPEGWGSCLDWRPPGHALAEAPSQRLGALCPWQGWVRRLQAVPRPRQKHTAWEGS